MMFFFKLKELEKTVNELRQRTGKQAVHVASSYGGLLSIFPSDFSL